MWVQGWVCIVLLKNRPIVLLRWCAVGTWLCTCLARDSLGRKELGARSCGHVRFLRKAWCYDMVRSGLGPAIDEEYWRTSADRLQIFRWDYTAEDIDDQMHAFNKAQRLPTHNNIPQHDRKRKQTTRHNHHESWLNPAHAYPCERFPSRWGRTSR